MSLKEYWKKRKFAETPEPEGMVSAEGGNRFVVQEHHATHLHYDFRLEMDGVLKSWAIPKGVPTESGIKHLAVQVEDHPVDYIDFEGTIPPDQYGAGTVKIWDSGDYQLLKRTPREIEFTLRGKRLTGRYILLSTGWKGKNNWLLFKVGASE